MSALRIVFMGTPDFAVPTLEALLAGPDAVAAVVCQPDRPRGRGKKLEPPPVKCIAQAAGLPLRGNESGAELGTLTADWCRQLMRDTAGRADPVLAAQILETLLANENEP